MTETTETELQIEPNAKKSKKATSPAKSNDSPFAQARAIFWRDPKQDKASFLAACEAAGMNKATAKTRFYCLTTGRDASCSDEKLRGR